MIVDQSKYKCEPPITISLTDLSNKLGKYRADANYTDEICKAF